MSGDNFIEVEASLLCLMADLDFMYLESFYFCGVNHISRNMEKIELVKNKLVVTVNYEPTTVTNVEVMGLVAIL